MYRGSKIIYSSENFRNLNKFQNYFVIEKINYKKNKLCTEYNYSSSDECVRTSMYKYNTY
jgi:hypothetical protein